MFVPHDAPVGNRDCARGLARQFGIVRDHEDGFPLIHQGGKQREDGGGGLGVEIARRFVSDQDLWVIGQGAGDGCALLLAG